MSTASLEFKYFIEFPQNESLHLSYEVSKCIDFFDEACGLRDCNEGYVHWFKVEVINGHFEGTKTAQLPHFLLV